jgi:hypothetical protein
MKKYIIVPPRRKNKKYSVLKYNSKTKDYDYLLSFGELYKKDGSFYEHYEDRTMLKLWSNLDHKDKERRKKFWLRHGKTEDKNSARYWGRYLW